MAMTSLCPLAGLWQGQHIRGRAAVPLPRWWVLGVPAQHHTLGQEPPQLHPLRAAVLGTAGARAQIFVGSWAGVALGWQDRMVMGWWDSRVLGWLDGMAWHGMGVLGWQDGGWWGDKIVRVLGWLGGGPVEWLHGSTVAGRHAGGVVRWRQCEGVAGVGVRVVGVSGYWGISECWVSVGWCQSVGNSGW